MGMLIVGFVLGVILAMIAALAIWFVLGPGRLIWRAMLLLAGASGGALLFCAASGEFQAEWLNLAGIVAATITALFVVLRQLGLKLKDTMARSHMPPDEMQFSLRQLMALTAVVAVIAAATRFLAPLIARWDVAVFGLAIGAGSAPLALLAAWATLRGEDTRLRLSLLALLAPVAAGVVYFVVETTDADPGLFWGAAVLAYAYALGGFLLLARWKGFRLCFDARRPEKGRSHAGLISFGQAISPDSEEGLMDRST